MKNKLVFLLLVLGILDSAYLTVVHFLPGALECPTVGTTINCESVLSSSFATVFGVPLALMGLAWFVVTLILFVYRPSRILLNSWLLLGAGGIIYSITAQSLLGKVCIYCSLLDVLIALSVGLLFYASYKK